MNERLALFPGSFDPFTNGHLSIVHRAAKLFDQVIIGVLFNTSKAMFLTPEERISLIQQSTANISNVLVVSSESGLTIDIAKEMGASFLIRGIRNSTDYEYERSIAYMNQQLDSNIESVFFMADNEYCNVSSSMIKEIAKFGGDVSRFIPPSVNDMIKKKYSSGDLH